MLKSENLRIRKYKYKDAVDLFNTLNDEEVTKNLPSTKVTLDEALESVDTFMNNYHMYTDYKYSFVIELDSTHQFIGWCGIGYMDFDKSAYGLNIVLQKDHWHKGYGTEACSLLIEYIRQMLNHEKIYAYIKAEDQATKNLVEKLGFSFIKKLDQLDDQFSFYNNGYYYELKL